MEDSVRKETERAMGMVAPGPHAILLLVPVSQFTEVGYSLYFLFHLCSGIISHLLMQTSTTCFW